MRSATAKSHAWDYLRDLKPDLALLQDVVSIPDDFTLHFKCRFEKATGKTGSPQKFSTAILVRGVIERPIKLLSQWDWVDKELDRFSGNLVAGTVAVKNHQENLNVISVYSPAWPVDPKRLAGVNLSELSIVEGQYGHDLWVTELLWATLQNKNFNEGIPWVIAGDFNLSETFETKRPNGPHGCKEFLDRMGKLGLTECLRHSNKKIVPTLKHSRGKVEDQLDHLFVSASLANRLADCVVGDGKIVFGQSLSDHLPIIADFAD